MFSPEEKVPIIKRPADVFALNLAIMRNYARLAIRESAPGRRCRH
jgi:hypothetical protein